MSLLLSDKVWVMLSEIAKRGVYPTHSAKLGIYRMPVDIVGQSEVNGVMSELKTYGYVLDTYADRIFVTSKWIEKGFDIYTNKEQSAELYVTVEIVIGEVLDIIYQIKPLETFGDLYWIRNYRQKADHNAKIIIDNIIRNTKIGQKLITYYQKIQKLGQVESIKKLESITPLANTQKNLKEEKKSLVNPSVTATTGKPSGENLGENQSIASSVAVPSPAPASNAARLSANTTILLTGTGTDYQAAEGPIDTGFKSKRQPVGKFQGIQVWGPYDPPGQLGIWGTDVCVDFDICISDGACIDACPVNVFEWLDTPGHPASDRKPFMIREKDYIFCLACENVCPPQAIKIFVK